jgi:hypothetical protein
MLRIDAAPTISRVRLQVAELRVEQLWQLAALTMSFIFALGVVGFTADTWWALEMGRLAVLAGRPVETVLGHAPALPEAANGQWLAQAVLYLMYSGSGERAVWVVSGCLIAASLGLVMVAARVGGAGPRAAALGVLLSGALAAQNMAVRTQLFGYLLFATTYLLLQLRRSHPRLLYLLPPIFALWANLHGSFALGLLLLGLYTAAETLEAAVAWGKSGAANRSAAGRLALVAAAALAATCLNPLGPGAYTYLLAALSHPTNREMGREWQPTTVRDLSGQILALSIPLTFVALHASRRRIAAIEVLLLLAFGYLALASLRYVVWTGMVLAPILARHAAGVSLPARLTGRLANPHRQTGARAHLNLAIAGLLVALAAAAPWWVPARIGHLRGAEAALAHAPVEAADFLATLPAEARLYNYQPWSGYLAWRLWPAQQPMVDVRFEAHPPSVWEDYMAIHLARADWESIVVRYGMDYLVLEPRAQNHLVEAAEGTGRWTRLYEDQTAVVLARRPS